MFSNKVSSHTLCILIKLYFYAKAKFTLEQATKAQRGSRGIDSSTLFLTLAVDWGRWSTPHPSCFTLGKTQYLLYRRLGGSQSRSRQVWKISPPKGFDPRTVQPVASRNTNYAIPAPYFYAYKIIFTYIVLNYFWPGKTCLASDLALTFECLPHHCSNA